MITNLNPRIALTPTEVPPAQFVRAAVAHKID
jgi:hypothetical protein